MYEKIYSDAQALHDEIVAWRRDFHQHPEISNKEVRTTATVAELLKAMGYQVKIGTQERPNISVVAELNSDVSGACVALRADMDALSISEESDVPWKSVNAGAMHACGHDAHMAMLLGAAKVLAGMKDELPGKVRLIFQHSEEVGNGSRDKIADGSLDGVDAIFGCHIWQPVPDGKIGLTLGPIMASCDKFELTIQGRGGHGSMPHLSIDPVVAACNVVSAWQTIVSRETDPLEASVISVGKIEAGTIFNAIPDSVYVLGTTRTFQPAVRAMLAKRMEEIASYVCKALRCEAHFTYHDSASATINDTELAKRALSSLQTTPFGNDVYLCSPTMGAEDFAYYQEKIPGVFLFLGTGCEEKGCKYPHHHPRFTIDEDVLTKGSAMLATLAKAFLDKKCTA